MYEGRCSDCNPACVRCYGDVRVGGEVREGARPCYMAMYGRAHCDERGPHASGFRLLGGGRGVCADCSPELSEEEAMCFVGEGRSSQAEEVGIALAHRIVERVLEEVETAECEETSVDALAAEGRLEGLLPPWLRRS